MIEINKNNISVYPRYGKYSGSYGQIIIASKDLKQYIKKKVNIKLIIEEIVEPIQELPPVVGVA